MSQERGAGPAILAAFSRPDRAEAALERLLALGFLNVEQEVEDGRTVLMVDAGDRRGEARAVMAELGGEELDRPT